MMFMVLEMGVLANFYHNDLLSPLGDLEIGPTGIV